MRWIHSIHFSPMQPRPCRQGGEQVWLPPLAYPTNVASTRPASHGHQQRIHRTIFQPVQLDRQSPFMRDRHSRREGEEQTRRQRHFQVASLPRCTQEVDVPLPLAHHPIPRGGAVLWRPSADGSRAARSLRRRLADVCVAPAADSCLSLDMSLLVALTINELDLDKAEAHLAPTVPPPTLERGVLVSRVAPARSPFHDASASRARRWARPLAVAPTLSATASVDLVPRSSTMWHRFAHERFVEAVWAHGLDFHAVSKLMGDGCTVRQISDHFNRWIESEDAVAFRRELGRVRWPMDTAPASLRRRRLREENERREDAVTAMARMLVEEADQAHEAWQQAQPSAATASWLAEEGALTSTIRVPVTLASGAPDASSKRPGRPRGRPRKRKARRSPDVSPAGGPTSSRRTTPGASPPSSTTSPSQQRTAPPTPTSTPPPLLQRSEPAPSQPRMTPPPPFPSRSVPASVTQSSPPRSIRISVPTASKLSGAGAGDNRASTLPDLIAWAREAEVAQRGEQGSQEEDESTLDEPEGEDDDSDYTPTPEDVQRRPSRRSDKQSEAKESTALERVGSGTYRIPDECELEYLAARPGGIPTPPMRDGLRRLKLEDGSRVAIWYSIAGWCAATVITSRFAGSERTYEYLVRYDMDDSEYWTSLGPAARPLPPELDP
eukprot:CAMPEP_0170753486 /NCGR_PEP_ID=MMETSP0437-20130122/12517_1 /TAXON_ID=0 /ORGANISM="Sexangularia sp." /LENGTH=665 /DNA_ID=CAMNT_0011092605 /DNA_START=27 /DNA_END=2020 /DNA_ORIENTATION=-